MYVKWGGGSAELTAQPPLSVGQVSCEIGQGNSMQVPYSCNPYGEYLPQL